MKFKKIILLVTSIILVLSIIFLFVWYSKKVSEKETVAQPVDMVEAINHTINNEFDITQLEDFNDENTISNNNETASSVQDTNTNTKPNKNANTPPYYIKVNYGAQVVTIYQKDENGNYTIPLKAMVCSTGDATPTSGVYSIPARWEWLRLQGYVWGHYSTQIKGNILFHSVPYLRKGDPASLEYWEYDKLGTYASAGCVRLKVSDAKWIYNNCKNGTKVEFYSSSDPGPLGKPSSKKISSYSDELRNWDPTDSNPNNPWKNYKPNNSDNNNNNNSNNNNNNNNTSNHPNKPTTNPDKTNTIQNTVVNDTKTNTITSDLKNNTITQNSLTNTIK